MENWKGGQPDYYFSNNQCSVFIWTAKEKIISKFEVYSKTQHQEESFKMLYTGSKNEERDTPRPKRSAKR